MRRDAAKTISRAMRDAEKWSRKTLRPAIRDFWKQRTVLAGAAGAAVPATRELIDEAEVRLGAEGAQRGAPLGRILPRSAVRCRGGSHRGHADRPQGWREIRRELGERADEIATRAKDEWVPMFERAAGGNGHVEQTIDDVVEGAADAGSTGVEAVRDAADDVADATGSVVDDASEAVGEAAEAIDRETST